MARQQAVLDVESVDEGIHDGDLARHSAAHRRIDNDHVLIGRPPHREIRQIALCDMDDHPAVAPRTNGVGNERADAIVAPISVPDPDHQRPGGCPPGHCHLRCPRP